MREMMLMMLAMPMETPTPIAAVEERFCEADVDGVDVGGI